MARVKLTQVRVVYQYRDEEGHRLKEEKGAWGGGLLHDMEADCPKCPEPKREPVVECKSRWHQWDSDGLRNHNVNYCAQCGQRLWEE